MTVIHPQAHVAPGAVLGSDVQIGPGVVVEDGVEVGDRTILLAGTILHTGTTLGAECRVGPYAVIGGTPMDTKFAGEPSFAVVEDHVVVREFATIHRATGEGHATRVGRGSLLMCYVHVTHNVQVGAHCVLTNTVQLGGHSQIGERAVLGNGAMVHQFTRVGTLAMVGAGSGVGSDILPYALAKGNPAHHYRVNGVGLKRHGFGEEQRNALNAALRHLRRRQTAEFDEMAASDPHVARMRAFIDSSQRGVARFAGG